MEDSPVARATNGEIDFHGATKPLLSTTSIRSNDACLISEDRAPVSLFDPSVASEQTLSQTL